MKAYLDCYPCFFSQALNTARRVTSDEHEVHEILKAVSLALPKLSFEVTPPEIGLEVYRIIAMTTGIDDPYKKAKTECTKEALALYPNLKARVHAAENPLFAAVKVAIAGNVIDFGANTEFDLEKDLEHILEQDFAINHYLTFCRVLEKAEAVLYIADNAGETVFDRVLIETIRKPVTYVVREKPIINDAVREDALEAGLDRVAKILSSGSPAPGTILRLCSEEFLKAYQEADLIISKGQGNYEGLSEEERPVFFLLKAKCGVIARDIAVSQGSLVLMKAKHL